MHTVNINIQRGDGGSEDTITVERFEEHDAVRAAAHLLLSTIRDQRQPPSGPSGVLPSEDGSR